MTHREHFFQVLTGQRPARMPFFPDITDWYVSARTPHGQPRPYGPGEFIPDDDPIHKLPGTMPDRFRRLTLLDFYREFDWGFPVHLYGWCETRYVSGVDYVTEVRGNIRTRRLVTARGELVRRDQLADDGTWAPRDHFVKSLADLDGLRFAVESARCVPRFDRVESILRQLGGLGAGDVVIHRSPFGKLVHEYMGFEQVIYALNDNPAAVLDFLALQEEKDLELVRLAVGAPARLVILSDHADQNLISPRQYDEFCIPYYRKMNAILHAAGKLVSTHLDGNFKGFFPLLAKTGFDLLDGCTPAPMFNYEVEELAAALPLGMAAYCGVPAVFFCQGSGTTTDDILAFGRRIIRALRGRGILNVGDILPPPADIDQVIALGEFVRRYEAEDG